MNLRHLTLYSDIRVGWYPKLDLRSVHFAQLETLALGQFVFSNDLPFEWIMKHSETLQELYLDHCSILYQSGAGYLQHEWLDEEGYQIAEPITPRYSHLQDQPSDQKLSFGTYTKRWHEIFNHFSTTLIRLHTFRFGSSVQWKFDVVNRYDDGSPGMPVMPWEGEKDLENEIFPERYLIWDDFDTEYSTKWSEGREYATKDPKKWDERDYKRFEDYPECNDEDLSALREFVKKLGMSNGDNIRVSEAKRKSYLYDTDEE